MLNPVDVDAECDHAQVVGEVHAVDHDRHQIQLRQIGGEQVGQRGLVSFTNRRETADLLVAFDTCCVRCPTGSNPTR